MQRFSFNFCLPKIRDITKNKTLLKPELNKDLPQSIKNENILSLLGPCLQCSPKNTTEPLITWEEGLVLKF